MPAPHSAHPDPSFPQHALDCSISSFGLFNLPPFVPFSAPEFFAGTLPLESRQAFSAFDPHDPVPTVDSLPFSFNQVEDFRPVAPAPSLEALQVTLSDIQQKIQQLQAVVQSMVHTNVRPPQDIAAQITSIMFQLMSTTAGLMQQSTLPPVQDVSLLQEVPQEATDPSSKDFVENFLATTMRETQNFSSTPGEFDRCNDLIDPSDVCTARGVGQAPPHQAIPCEDDASRHHPKDDEEAEIEELPPDSYDIVELNATEILAEHTHFCEICGKGFKRDANLRMHMRSHGDEYKTSAALAKPLESYNSSLVARVQRYSCPFLGCRRNRKHDKFLPLKTLLCVKNHYRRSHCPKTFTCNKCKAKKFSVLADLKTHEKHCGCSKWQCSCGTTFSRKDKLSGHIGLFPGHTPVLLSMNEEESSEGPDSDELASRHVPDWGDLPSHGSIP